MWGRDSLWWKLRQSYTKAARYFSHREIPMPLTEKWFPVWKILTLDKRHSLMNQSCVHQHRASLQELISTHQPATAGPTAWNLATCSHSARHWNARAQQAEKCSKAGRICFTCFIFERAPSTKFKDSHVSDEFCARLESFGKELPESSRIPVATS